MPDFSKDAYIKIVDVNGNYRYGFIKQCEEKGFHLLICMHEEGNSAIEYEIAAGAVEPDWDKLLTDTEKDIIPLLGQSLLTKEIANILEVSPVTIRAHIRTLRIKLGLENRLQLVAFAQAVDKRLQEEMVCEL